MKPLRLALFFLLAGGLAAQTPQWRRVAVSGSDREVFYMFVTRHDWLVSSLGLSTTSNPYGIAPAEFARISAAVHSVKQDLTELEKQAADYRTGNKGAEYIATRERILAQGASRVQSAVSAPSWQKVSAYLYGTVAPSMVVYSYVPPAADTARAGAQVQRADCTSNCFLVISEQIAYYNNGLAGRSDSYFNGDPQSLSWTPSVTGVKGSFNGAAFYGPTNASAAPGGDAWAGWIKTSTQTAVGTYKEESFHSYHNNSTGDNVPPFPGITIPPGSAVTCDASNGYCAVSYAAGIQLSASIPQEANKPTHYLTLNNCSSPVVITANPTPSSPPPTITWTGGTAGYDNLHQQVACASAGDTDVTAAIGNIQTTVRIHVVASQAPPATNQANLSHTLIGQSVVPGNAFGLTVVTIGQQGVTQPAYNAGAYLSTDRWVYRVSSIDHGYKVGTHSLGRTNLPQGDILPFPIAPGLPDTATAYNTARSDLNTSGLVGQGPPRTNYWVDYITQNHENAHVDHFYSASFWNQYMGTFISHVEDPSAFTIYDCTNPQTTTAANVISANQGAWDADITNQHNAADQAEIPSSETYAHGVSNPQYVPIWSAIPASSAPTIANGGFSPTSVTRGSSGYFVIYGDFLNASPTVGVDGYGVSPSFSGGSYYIGKTQLNIFYSVATDATTGPHTLTVQTAFGSVAQTITVN